MTTHPFRFGVGPAELDLRGRPGAWPAFARHVEELGYSSVNVGDHPSARVGSGAGPFALLTAAAAATTTLRVGALVLGGDFRPAVVTAQEALAVHHLSGGRLELGVGAGWAPADYEAVGLPYDGAAVRIDRLAETVAVLRQVLAGEECVLDGDHVRVRVAPNPLAKVVPAPPPLVLGGGGRRMLALAGRVADVVTVNVSLGHGLGAGAYGDATAAATDEKLAVVAAAAAERTGAPPERQVYVHRVVVTDDRSAALETVASATGLTPDEVAASPHFLVGSADELAADLGASRDRWGFSYVTWDASAAEAMAPVVARLTGI